MTSSLGFGQGLIRLLQFSGVLASENKLVCVPDVFLEFHVLTFSIETTARLVERPSAGVFHTKGGDEIHALEGQPTE